MRLSDLETIFNQRLELWFWWHFANTGLHTISSNGQNARVAVTSEDKERENFRVSVVFKLCEATE